MASTTKHFSLFLLLLTLLSSLHVHARDSQFFSKVSNNNNAKETQVPNKEQPLTNKQEQEPNFIPQTQDAAGYGLYGHESGQLPPSATTTTTTTNGGAPYTTTDNLPSNKGLPSNYNEYAYVTEPQGYTTPVNNYIGDNMYKSQKQGNGERYYRGGNMYNNQKQGAGETRFMDRGYATPTNGNNHHNNGGNMYNNQKQGMSDTRFLENGKYYYDLDSERYNSNANENSRGFGSRDEHNSRGYYRNNENSFENNSMGGYQNQEDFQDQDDQDMP